MEARLLVCGIALAAAFCCLYAIVRSSLATWNRRCAASGEALSPAAIAHWRIRNGVPTFKPLAQWLLEFKPVEAFARKGRTVLESRDVALTSETMVTLLIAASLVAAALAFLLFKSVAVALLVPICSIAAIDIASGNIRSNQLRQIQETIPDALESMSACFGSGYTLQQTFDQVAKETEGALSLAFASAAHALEAGSGATEVLDDLRKAGLADEMSFVVVALDIQHQTGGSIKQVIDAAADSVKGELALRRSLRVQTAQAELSARIVSAMPLVLVLLFSLVSPGFLTPFFSSATGWALLVIALAMQVSGILLVRRALTVEVSQ